MTNVSTPPVVPGSPFLLDSPGAVNNGPGCLKGKTHRVTGQPLDILHVELPPGSMVSAAMDGEVIYAPPCIFT